MLSDVLLKVGKDVNLKHKLIKNVQFLRIQIKHTNDKETTRGLV